MSLLVKKILGLMLAGWLMLLIVAGFVTKLLLARYIEHSQQFTRVVRLDLLSYEHRFFSARGDLRLTIYDPALQTLFRDVFSMPVSKLAPTLILHLKISHGPLILAKNLENHIRPRWGFGLITIDVDVPAVDRQALKPFISDQSLCRIQSLVTFFANVKTNWKTPSVAYQPDDKIHHFLWPGMSGTLRIARQHAAIEKNIIVMPMDMAWESHGKSLQFTMGMATHRATYVKGNDDLWYGQSHFVLPNCEARIDNQTQMRIERAEMHYAQQAQLGTFHIQSQAHIDKIGFGPKDVFGPLRWDFHVGHLDMKTLSDFRHVLTALRSNSFSGKSNNADQLLVSVLKTLLQKGADIDIRQCDLQTPMGLAQIQGQFFLPVQATIESTQPWANILLQGDLDMKAQMPASFLQGLWVAKQWLVPDVGDVRTVQDWQTLGYIQPKNNDFVSHLRYEKGIWNLNGKKMNKPLIADSPLTTKASAYISPIKSSAISLPITHEFDDE
jgi:uncharacterized protein YdgA (DUF945 family)